MKRNFRQRQQIIAQNGGEVPDETKTTLGNGVSEQFERAYLVVPLPRALTRVARVVSLPRQGVVQVPSK